MKAKAKTAKKKLATLVLDPKRWRRGAGWGSLLGFDNKMCCLGFECIRRGLSESDIIDVDLPSGVKRRFGKGPFRTLVDDEYMDRREVEDIIAEINDDDCIETNREGDLARVRKLRPLFKRLGVHLVLGKAK